jgi:hypothetical protein
MRIHKQKGGIGQLLRNNQNIWKSFVFGRFKSFELIELRDLRYGVINADTLYLVTDKAKLADFGGGLGRNEILVRVWWD